MKIAAALFIVVANVALAAEPTVRLTIDIAQPGRAVSPMMHGVFFEDINYGADGGLYAELVQNRSFEHRESLYAWATVSREADGTAAVESSDPLNPSNPHYLRLNVRAPGKGFGIANHGFGGIVVKQGDNYLVSFSQLRNVLPISG
jgi:alpha-N-arabinofuranosidase